MRKIILDTDMGVDCDDAAALAIMLNAHKSKKIELLGVTASSGREGATATIKAIMDYYQVKDIPIGSFSSDLLECDLINNYAKPIKDRYKIDDVNNDSVNMIRKILSTTADKVTIVAIGPLTNMANLLISQADEYSSLNGIELVKEKVDKFLVMGGAFIQNYSKDKITAIFSEWNILQDIKSAITFSELCPLEIIYSPHEVGNVVLTKMGKNENPVWLSMLEFAKANKFDFEPDFYRQSWDPITCLFSLDENNPDFTLSSKGIVKIDDKGITTFVLDNDGKDYYISTKSNLKNIEKRINEIIEIGSEL